MKAGSEKQWQHTLYADSLCTACCSVYGTEADQTKIPAQTTEEVQVLDENGENRVAGKMTMYSP